MFPVPTGGAVRMKFPGYLQSSSGITFMALARAVSGVSGLSAFTPFYSGAPLVSYVDVGDGTAGPLDPATAYVWQVTDDTGSIQLGPLTPAGQLDSAPDQLTNLLIWLLQGALNSLTLPPGFPAPGNGQPVKVTTQMPANGLQAMPFIVVNLDLIQQSEVALGEDANFSPTNEWTLFVNAKRMWRVTVVCQSAMERDFYRDNLLIIFRVLKATVFGPIGYGVTHSFQANSYTDAKEWEGMVPGFYGADLMLELDGVFNTTVLTNYAVIQAITVNATIDPNIETISVNTNISPFNETI